MEVYIAEGAFLGILLATVETYNRECMGLLIGIPRQNGDVAVQHALPYQVATRTNFEVTPSATASQRMENVLKDFTHVELVGDFHSHPAGRKYKATIYPSPLDRSFLEPGKLKMIVEIHRRERAVRWKYNRDGTISGSLDDFFLKLAAWHLDGERGQARLATLRCPFALDFRG
ncbi:MAG: Mov34/MPN/PAD-1 family protein [Nitrospinae bacterium]|nr:Mov34/MPN/PAD-1 family protein [Nitrospinota bacterium]